MKSTLTFFMLLLFFSLAMASNTQAASSSALEGRLNQFLQIYNEVLYPAEPPLRFTAEPDNDGDPHAFKLQDSRSVGISKGFVNNKNLTPDGQMMTLCHEIGHHFGGAPKRMKSFGETLAKTNNSPYSWSSVEGQADYYAAAKCAKMIFAFDDLSLQPKAQDADPNVRKLCDQAYSQELDKRICYRINIAGLNMLESYNTHNESFDFSKKADALTEVGVLAGHPDKQCRLDTILAGSICNIAADAKPDSEDPNKNYCTTQESRRPRCWYNKD